MVLAFVSLSGSGPGSGSDLSPNQFLRIEPSHDVRCVTLGHGPAGVVEHQAKVFPFPDLEVVEDDVQQGRSFRLFVQVKRLVGVVQKCHLLKKL